jgi:uncharacterized protein (TIGR02145 family)
MKNLYLVLSLCVLLATSYTYAQNDSLYVYKAGIVINKQSIKTVDVDSITFYKPTPIVPSTATVTIGTQVWTTKNLDVTTYTDGTPIPQVTDPTEWAALTTGAWCYYNNDAANGTTYGKLYNWYAVVGVHDTDPNTPNKILAPTGYHIPTDAEWITLTTFLGGEGVAGGQMKEAGTTHWNSPNQAATNSSGFAGLASGYCGYNGGYFNFGFMGKWWSITSSDTNYAYCLQLINSEGYAVRDDPYHKRHGYSVRCLKD